MTENCDGFLFFLGNSENDKQLIINPKKISKIVKYINENKILCITVNDAYFDKIENLDFLKEIPNVEEISILQNNLNLKPIENLKSLKSLSFSETTEKLNLNKFHNLEILGCDYRKVENLKECKNLKSVSLHFYNKENLVEFENFDNLEILFLVQTSIKNFNGIEKLKNINKIELHNSPKLESLNGLPRNSEKLRTLFIYNAKNLIDYGKLDTLKNLKKLQLVSGGEIENLEIFEKMNNLEYLQLGMNIKNGDKIELMNKINKK
ncbi:protein phosphatase 1 regulatory subunit 7 [Flavobacterium noncentrifugens]|uniref:Protein phosphatase 1 regulatory subunit 7 n=2 Tax=Flavobacterium noncentrifugens TaxID=1128970 RepID=A0A1G8Y374_9FLAO|nr:protein phosphatase 1 regulatory subunit 7 [Flavobacterium noncentrifugens]